MSGSDEDGWDNGDHGRNPKRQKSSEGHSNWNLVPIPVPDPQLTIELVRNLEVFRSNQALYFDVDIDCAALAMLREFMVDRLAMARTSLGGFNLPTLEREFGFSDEIRKTIDEKAALSEDIKVVGDALEATKTELSELWSALQGSFSDLRYPYSDGAAAGEMVQQPELTPLRRLLSVEFNEVRVCMKLASHCTVAEHGNRLSQRAAAFFKGGIIKQRLSTVGAISVTWFQQYAMEQRRDFVRQSLDLTIDRETQTYKNLQAELTALTADGTILKFWNKKLRDGNESTDSVNKFISVAESCAYGEETKENQTRKSD